MCGEWLENECPHVKEGQEGGPSLRECFALVREWSSLPVRDINHLLDAVIFAALIGNADAHGKNHSLLYTAGSRRLAPLYDQVCTLAWPEISHTLAMKIGKARTLPEISPEHFRQLATEAKLGWPMVRARLADLCRKVLSQIPTGDATVHVQITRARAERMIGLVKKL